MKKNITNLLYYLVIICSTCTITASAQQSDFLKNQFPSRESKNIFKRDDAESAHKQKFVLPRGRNNQKETSVNGLVQLIDSFYAWGWDTLTVNWKLQAFQKDVNFMYDPNNNCLGYEMAQWNGSAWINSQKF